MFEYIMHFNCSCSDSSFVTVFNKLNQLIGKDNIQEFPPKSNWHTTYEIPRDLCKERPNSNGLSNSEKSILVSQITQYCPVSHNTKPENTMIMVTVEIPFDERNLDVSSYRYLIMIARQLLRPQDFAVIKCDFQHYNKIGSYFIMETMQSKKVFAYVTRNDGTRSLISMPMVISLSSEWFPAIYLSGNHDIVYQILNNPLFDSDKSLEEALRLQKVGQDGNHINCRNINRKASLENKPHNQEYLKKCFQIWMNGELANSPIVKRLNSVSGMAQLLFAALFRNLHQSRVQLSDDDNIEKLENLLEICCDFSDCILQVAENMVSHSKGGVLSIRINANWEKISDVFKPANEDVKKLGRYVRISLVDFSENGIINTIQKTTKLDSITLSHVFSADNLLDDSVYAAYQHFLSEADHVIHHYGLSVFSNVVNQYEGCFTVSSCSIDDFQNTKPYVTKNTRKVLFAGAESRDRIPGTEYDILLVLDEQMLTGQQIFCNPSLLVTPDYIMESPTQKVVFQEEIFDFFNDPLSKLIRSKNMKQKYQDLKELVVEEASKRLSEQLIAYEDMADGLKNCVFYFYLSNVAENTFGRVEIVAKILLRTVSILKQKYGDSLHLYGVLYGLSENRVASFSRQFALFYHRSEGNQLMKNCQLYVMSENYRAEVLFAGPKLRAISDYCKSRRLVSGTTVSIANMLEHVAYREADDYEADNRSPIVPIPFDLLYRMEICDGRICLSTLRKWYYSNLMTVLNNDIHGRDLGCRMENVHIRTEKVHLNTFYEGQLLFSNTYWYHIFADYLCEMIYKNDYPDKNTKILLYGYETYSEQMLVATARKLEDKGISAWYALYENPKYITVSATSETRIRYLSKFLKECGDGPISIIYIFGIGTTLATMDTRMNAQLQKEFDRSNKSSELANAIKKGYVIIQIEKTDEPMASDPEIICDNQKHIVKTTKGYLDFLQEKQCRYLASVSAQWASAEHCPHCFPERYLDELPLIQTNETSTIPLLLIKPSDLPGGKTLFLQEQTYCEEFLNDPQNADYLYYSHLDRSGNHYQFYIRTASLINDLLNKDENPLKEWLKQIKQMEFPEEQSQVNKISVLVAPLHFSNEAFTAAVNRYVFDGKGYIINFDVKKEFRDSFVAKFRNYRSALEMMTTGKIGTRLELNFYFVDDNIVTGSTLNRARSLLSSMIGDALANTHKNISVNLFKGIIVLIDRNSKSSVRHFFDRPLAYCRDENVDVNQPTTLPFYRFIGFNTPSIRSYGDSCPLCNKVEKLKRLERESALSFVEQHWEKKAEYHSLIKLSDARKSKEIINVRHSEDALFQTRGFRRLQCSEWIWKMLKEEGITNKNAREKLEEIIVERMDQQSSNELKIEYLISFLKVVSREHIVYQEGINTAALQILLAIFSLYIGDGAQAPSGLYKRVSQLITAPTIQKENPRILYELYQIVIARLCAMGSVVLCRKKQLDACLETGFYWESLCHKHDDHNPGASLEIEDFSVFLCIQMKKMLFATRDCDLRIKTLRNVLRKYLEEGGLYCDRFEQKEV